jgi:hypothetical protein
LIEFSLLVLEKRTFKKISVFLFSAIISPWGKAFPFHLSKLESPSPKDDFCHVWIKLVVSAFGEEVKM